MQWMAEESGWLLPDDSTLPADVPHEILGQIGAAASQTASCVLVGSRAGDARASGSAMQLCAAISAAGGETVFVPECTAGELGLLSRELHSDLLLYCGANIRMTARGLLPMTAAAKRILCAPQQIPVQRPQDYGRLRTMPAPASAYTAYLRGKMPPQPVQPIAVTAGDARQGSLLEHAVSPAAGGRALHIQLSADGARASLYAPQTGWIFWEQLLLMDTQQRLMRGEDVALPFWLPHSAERMAAQAGCRILRYHADSEGGDSEARALAVSQGFTLDAAVLTADILRFQADGMADLRKWAAEIPPAYTVRRLLHTEQAVDAASRSALMTCAAQTPDGLCCRDSRGDVLLHPAGGGRLSVLIEAVSMEAAAELYRDVLPPPL